MYTVTYKDIDSSTIPLHIWVLDASNCLVEYNVEEDAQNKVVTTDYSWKMPGKGEVVWAVGHQHVGGINITLSASTTSKSSALRQQQETEVCRSVPTYGTGGAADAGNESGYVTAMSTCSFDDPKTRPALEKGDTISVHSVYNVDPQDPRSFDKGGHGGVMSLFYVATAGEAGSDPVGPHTGPDGPGGKGGSDGLNGGWIAFIVVLVVLLLTWLGIGLVWYRRRQAGGNLQDGPYSRMG